jgi:outer membrane protein OmpA-like peptidoglycan-associated protein
VKKFIVFGVCCLFLSACGSSHTPLDTYRNSSTTTKGAVLGGIAGGAVGGVAMGGPTGVVVGGAIGAAAGGLIGAYVDKHHTEVEKLKMRNVQVVRVGDYVRLIIPTSQLFYNHTDSLAANADSTLDAVIDFIEPMPKIAIAVSAYTAGELGAEEEAEISGGQAQAVADYLWSNGADTRLITAQGYGNQKPVSFGSNASVQENSRVEITLRDLGNS